MSQNKPPRRIGVIWSQTFEACRPQWLQIGLFCITSARSLRHALELYGPSLNRGLFAKGRGLIFGSGFFGMGAKLGTKKRPHKMRPY